MNFFRGHKKPILFFILVLIILGYFIYQKINKPKMIVFMGEKEYLVDIATREIDLVRGLSGRKSLGQNDGMLFVFDYPDNYGIWMRKMNFPLDVVWISEKYEIVDFRKSLATSTYPEIFYPIGVAKYALEISAGELEKLNIKIGDAVKFVKK